MLPLDALGQALGATTTLVWLVPLLPLLAALLIGMRRVLRREHGDAQETVTVSVASGGVLAAFVLLLVFDVAAMLGAPAGVFLGEWFRIGAVPVRLSFLLDRYSLPLATLIALIGWLTLRFSASYLHRERGYERYFLGLCLFVGGMLLIVLAGNAVLAFVGWELAGISSWLLVSYSWERPLATANALAVFVTNRLGDAGFLLGIALAVWSAGTIEWTRLAGDGTMITVTARLLGAGFVLAALVKSAQLPFTPWLARALEGPTPSSAIFYGSLLIHAGVFLLCRAHPLLQQVPDMMAFLVVVGALTALYGGLCALVQSDVKSALVHSAVSQVGLMFILCGLGLCGAALAYAGMHAAWRAYQFLLAPSILQMSQQPAPPVRSLLAKRRWWYTAVLQRFWLERLALGLLAKPTLALGRDVILFDERFIDRLIGRPGPGSADAGALGESALIRGDGLAGHALLGLSSRLQAVEERLLPSGDGSLVRLAKSIARYADTVESLLEQPRYLMLMVLATFVVIL